MPEVIRKVATRKRTRNGNHKRTRRRERTDTRASAHVVRGSQFPTLDLTFLEDASFVVYNQKEMAALQFMKTLHSTTATNPDLQLNQIAGKITETDYYPISRAECDDGSPAIMIPICYHDFE